MNKLNSLQRKFVYIGGMLLLLIPIIFLGRPATSAAGAGAAAGADSGGLLTQLRTDYELGEQTLGNVDPASATMNLVLLGMRGVATSVLWMEAEQYKERKNWAELRSTTESIIQLQPHFLKVWSYQGWNLAYNVSAEWDLVADRYYWVKEGIKFLEKGVDRNRKYPELYWYTGDTLGKKIGRPDEWRQFRRFFLKDPDEVNYPSGIDDQINPTGEDNYLVARTWFQKANEVMDRYGNEQHIMAVIIFRGYPTRSLYDYAGALQREGLFGERAQTAWENAYREWTGKYGQELFACPIGLIHMEVVGDELERIQREDALLMDESQRTLHWVGRYQDMINYRYWRARGQAEAETNTANAHQNLFLAERKYLEGDFAGAIALYLEGMKQFEKVLADYPDLHLDDDMIEEGMIAQLFWRAALRLEEEEPPEDFPLKGLWLEHQARIPVLQDEFKRRQRPPVMPN